MLRGSETGSTGGILHHGPEREPEGTGELSGFPSHWVFCNLMPHPVFRRSLRQAGLRVWRSVIVAGMISLAALAVWTVIVHGEARQLALRDAESNAAVVAHAIAREQERLIDTAQQLLLGLSARQEVLTASAGPCSVLFAGVVKGFPGYLDLAAV